MMKNEINIVGIGPGRGGLMTEEARLAIAASDVIIGYTVYVDLVRPLFPEKEYISTPMRREEERCRICFEQAAAGRRACMICGGDAGIYGLASPMIEIGGDYPDIDIKIIPGVTAASAGAALLGAPLGNDFCAISLSDALTPWETVEKRLRAAAAGDFAIAIYNPASRRRPDYLKKACDILLEMIEPDRPCGYARNIGRAGESSGVCTLSELRGIPADMFTTAFVGNSQSEIVKGRLIVKRGYFF